MQVGLHYSDDYAVLDSGKYSFYYGYECQNSEEEYMFVVKENNKVIFQTSTSNIEQSVEHVHLDNMQDYLLAGIGMWLLLKK